jgi:Ca-activated chloride channel family protein
MSFDWPAMLLGLALVPLLGWGYWRGLRRNERYRAGLGALEGSPETPGRLAWRRRWLPALMLLGLTLLLLAIGRPRAMVSLPHVEGTVVLAVDVSNSMRADDVEPTRLDAAKAAARAFAERLPSNVRVGVVAFGGGGVVVQPPTDDRAATLQAIDRLTAQGGTSLGEGIFVALGAAGDHPTAAVPPTAEGEVPTVDLGDLSSAVVVLFSDGENTRSPDPLTVAQTAAEAGARIFAVGVGTSQGAVLEQDGFNILTQLDETELQQIAETTNAVYYRAGDDRVNSDVNADIARHMTVRGEAMEVTSIFAGAGMMILLVAGMLSLWWFGRIP